MLVRNTSANPASASAVRSAKRPEKLDTKEGIRRILEKEGPLTGPERIALTRYYSNSRAGTGNSQLKNSTVEDLRLIEELLGIKAAELKPFKKKIVLNNFSLEANKFNTSAIDILDKAAESAISNKEGFLYTSNVLWALLTEDKEISSELTTAGIEIGWFKDLEINKDKVTSSYFKPQVSNGIKDGLTYLLGTKKSRITSRDLLNIALNPDSDVSRIFTHKGNGLSVKAVREKLSLGLLPFDTK